MDDFAVDAVGNVSRTGVFSRLAVASNDPPQSSVEAWGTAMAAASSRRSAAERSQLGSANALASDKTQVPDHDGGGSRIDCGLGILQAGVGILEAGGGVGGGVAPSETGVGAVASGVLAWHGLDDIPPGVRQAWTGKPTETFTRQPLTSGARQAPERWSFSPGARVAVAHQSPTVAGKWRSDPHLPGMGGALQPQNMAAYAFGHSNPATLTNLGGPEADWPVQQFQPPPWPGDKFTGFMAGFVAGAKDTLFHTRHLDKKLHQGDRLFNAGVFVGLMVAVPFAALGARSVPTETSAAATVERATGAFRPGVQLKGGLGIFAERELTVTQKGLDLVKAHLARPEFGGAIDPIENAMVQRLENALASGKRVSGADAIFYTHELAEATMMARGMLYEQAHTAALEKYGVSPLSVFHPDVIRSLPPGYLNYRWYQFWGIK
jgi:hypothetical protein